MHLLRGYRTVTIGLIAFQYLNAAVPDIADSHSVAAPVSAGSVGLWIIRLIIGFNIIAALLWFVFRFRPTIDRSPPRPPKGADDGDASEKPDSRE